MKSKHPLTWLFILISTCWLLSNSQLAQAVEGITIGNYQLTSSKRITRTIFEYTYKATVTNSSQDILKISVSLADGLPGITVSDRKVEFGVVPVDSSVVSIDTFTIRQDRLFKLDANSLIWNIEATKLTTYHNDQYNFTVLFPSNLDTLETSIKQPNVLNNRNFQNLGNDGGVIFSITVYDNSDQLPISDWYNEILSDKEYTLKDSGLRVSHEVLVNGVAALQLESVLMGTRFIRTFVPNGTSIIGIRTSLPDTVEIPAMYFQILNSLKLI